MDLRLIEAKQKMLQYEDILKALYPDLLSIGTPCYTLPPRISFMLRLCDGKHKCSLASHLILEALLGRRLTSQETCDHIDGDPTNDNPNNLQVMSRSSNARKGPNAFTKAQAILNGANARRGNHYPALQGSNNGKAKLTDDQVRDIRVRLSTYIRGQDAIIAAEYGVSRELISGIRRGTLRNLL